MDTIENPTTDNINLGDGAIGANLPDGATDGAKGADGAADTENLVVFPATSDLVIRFAKDAQVVKWDALPDHIKVRLACHGLKQLTDDKMAGAEMDGGLLVKNGKVMKIDGAYMHSGSEVFAATFKRLSAGEWSERKIGNKVSSLPWSLRWLYGICEDKAPAFILAGRLVIDGKVVHDVTKKNLAAMREALFTGDKFAKWRELQLKNVPPEPVKPVLTDEELAALMDDEDGDDDETDGEGDEPGPDDSTDEDTETDGTDGADESEGEPEPEPEPKPEPARKRGRK